MTVYNPDPVYFGDTWPGIPSISILVNGSVPSVAVVSASLTFSRAGSLPGSTPATGTTLASPSGVTITSTSGWTFAVQPGILPLAQGDWILHFKTTDSAGAVHTWLTGTLTIL